MDLNNSNKNKIIPKSEKEKKNSTNKELPKLGQPKKPTLENNSLLKELNRKAEKEFEQIILFLNDENNKNDKILFYKFLLGDIIPKKLLDEEKSYLNNITDIIYDPINLIENYIYLMLENNYDNSNFLKEEIKKSLKRSILDKNKKIDECNEHINLLKKTFLDLNLEKKIPMSEKTIDLVFKNKTVLQTDKLEIGEVFARYLFTLIDKNKNIINSTASKFYENEKINSYYITIEKDKKKSNFINSNKIKTFPKNEETIPKAGNYNPSNPKTLKPFYKKPKLNHQKRKKSQRGGNPYGYIVYNNEDNDEGTKNEGEENNDGENEDEENEGEENEGEENLDSPINVSEFAQAFTQALQKTSKLRVTDFNNNEIVIFESDFSKINNNFKYWIFLIKLIINLFSKDSDYGIFFNEKKLNSEIDNLVLIERENQKKDGKKKQKNGKKFKKRDGQRGGGKSEEEIKREALRKIIGKIDPKDLHKNKVESSLKRKYIEVFEKCFIQTKKENLKKIYIDPYSKAIDHYFKEEVEKNKGYSLETKIKNPFNQGANSKPLKTYTKSLNLKNIKFDIFQSLYLLKNPLNKEEIYKFLEELKMKLIYILYFLYKIKKNIYSKYIEILNSKINYNNNQEPNYNKSPANEGLNSSVNKNSQKESQKKDISKNTYFSSSNIESPRKNNSIEIKKIDYYIYLLKKKISDLEDKRGIRNYDKIILELEEEIKRAIIEKHSIF